MKKCVLFCVTILLLIAAKAGAQDSMSYNERAKKYIKQYYPLAIAEQRRSGIPASITLGQGILETEAGISELMTEANNHFGIKCKNGWQGETFTHTDDEPDECFKKYKCAEDSYKDHSDHLRINQRYAPLFKIAPTDYASWAVCLKKCGYATNPQYAQKLIKIIEDYKLQEFTYSALDSSLIPNYSADPVLNAEPVMDTDKKPPVSADTMVKQDTVVKTDTGVKLEVGAGIKTIQEMADSARNLITRPVVAEPIDSNDIVDTNYDKSRVVTINGLKAFYGNKNEMMLQYAVKYHLRYPKLLEINDLPDSPLPFGMYVYLEKKLTVGTHPDHVVKHGENLLKIAQEEGMQLKRLMTLNLLNPNEQPMEGDTLQLQTQALRKPDVITNEITAHKKNAFATSEDNGQNGDYIPIKRVKTDTPKRHAAIRQPVAKPIPPKHLPTKIAVVKTDTVINTNPNAEYADDYVKDRQEQELASLKAELDKVVYADDSKLIAETAPPPPETKIEEPAAAKGSKYYTVKRGDTAFSIAKKNNITLDELMKWNHLGSGGVKLGQSLQVKE